MKKVFLLLTVLILSLMLCGASSSANTTISSNTHTVGSSSIHLAGNDYMTVGGTVNKNIGGLPFYLNFHAPDTYNPIISTRSHQSVNLNGITAKKIHFIQWSGNAVNYQNGYITGKITVKYNDDTFFVSNASVLRSNILDDNTRNSPIS